MNRIVIVLVGVVAVGAALLLLLSGEREGRSAEDLLREAAEREEARPPEAPALPPALAPAARPPEPAGERRTPGPHGSVDVRTLPKGTLLVVVVDADERPVAPDLLHLGVGPAKGDRDWPSAPVFRFDVESGTWRADDVPAGAVELKVSGDHVVAQTQTLRQTTEATEPVKVKVEAAGAIQYRVTLADGTVPEHVTLALLDEKERPVPARFQARSATLLTTPRTGTSVKLGPEGVVMGVKPGRYVLRATSPTENVADTKVDVVAGTTTELPVVIRG